MSECPGHCSGSAGTGTSAPTQAGGKVAVFIAFQSICSHLCFVIEIGWELLGAGRPVTDGLWQVVREDIGEEDEREEDCHRK